MVGGFEQLPRRHPAKKPTPEPVAAQPTPARTIDWRNRLPRPPAAPAPQMTAFRDSDGCWRKRPLQPGETPVAVPDNIPY